MIRVHPPLPGQAFRRSGLTLIECLVIVVILLILLVLMLPAVRSTREAARRMACSNNLKQLGLALHNYHDSFGFLPTAMGGTGGDGKGGNANRLSGLVAMLPFLEQEALWTQIAAPLESEGITFPAMGPAPWNAEYPPWTTQVTAFRCPADIQQATLYGLTNYAFCIGDSPLQIHAPVAARGAFACRLSTRFQDVLDGSSYTIAMAEIATDDGRRLIGQYAIHQPKSILESPERCYRVLEDKTSDEYREDVQLGSEGRGGVWSDGAACFTLINTILPPNGPSCAVGGSDAVDGTYSSGSYHPTGSLVVYVDGHVRFISETIDSGDLSAKPVLLVDPTIAQPASPYGVWGSMGTAAGGDVSED